MLVLVVAGCGPSTMAQPKGTSAGGTVTYSVHLTPGECHARDGGTLPDPACTPGALDPRVTQATIHSTICVAGWTATVRPPVAETNHAKWLVSAPAYSLPAGTVGEEDHLIPLELGGSSDITNLWLEAGKIPNSKDTEENRLHKLVCGGKMTLAAGQHAIALNWHTAP